MDNSKVEFPTDLEIFKDSKSQNHQFIIYDFWIGEKFSILYIFYS